MTLPNFSKTVDLYEGFSSIDLPVWTAVVISCSAWEKAIVADDNFVFHLWFPDVAMQFMNNNYFVCLDNSEIIINNWKLKEKYGLLGSVEAGKKKNGRMEAYGKHFKVWKAKWGYDYENPNTKKNLPIKPGSILKRTIDKKTLAPLMKFDL